MVRSLLAAVAAVGVLAGCQSSSSPAADPLTATTAPAPGKVPAKAPGKPSDKGWVVQSLTTKNDGLGDWGGLARITNGNRATSTGTFTFTLSRGGKILGTLQGAADGASPGQTVSVDLVSQDKYTAGPVTWVFQTDTSF